MSEVRAAQEAVNFAEALCGLMRVLYGQRRTALVIEWSEQSNLRKVER